jgi:hypothetical protein
MDEVKTCPRCRSGALVRKFAAPFGPLRYADIDAPPVSRESRVRPNKINGNIVVDNCATGIKVSGGHTDMTDLTITMTNTPTAFELDCGAVIDIANVNHHTGDKKKNKRNRKPKRRKKN